MGLSHSWFHYMSTTWRQNYSFSIRDASANIYFLQCTRFFTKCMAQHANSLHFSAGMGVLSSAETYCTWTPTYPPLASCDRVITTIERFVRESGNYERTFGPEESEATIKLPIWFADIYYDGEWQLQLLARIGPQTRVRSGP